MKDLSGADVTQTLEIIQRVWRSALGTQRVIYLSGPITTGKRFIEWYERAGSRLNVESKAYKEALRAEVIVPNERDLQQAAELLRARDGEPVIEPASLFVMRWKQSDYVELWEKFISDHARDIVLMPGWQYSAGCAAEYCRAQIEGIPTASIDGTPIVARDAVAALQKAIAELESMLRPPQSLLTSLRNAGQKLGGAARATNISAKPVRKDQSLDQLAEQINVAQFVSFEPVRHHPRQMFSRVLGEAANTHFKSTRHAAEVLLETKRGWLRQYSKFYPREPAGPGIHLRSKCPNLNLISCLISCIVLMMVVCGSS